MRKVQKILMYVFWSAIVFSLIIIILYEMDILSVGIITEDKVLSFILLSVMEVVTLCLIPIALRLFKFKRIRSKLLSDNHKEVERNLTRWGLIRMNMIILPMIVNMLFYYWSMNVAFGYMSIICLLCLVFIYPSVKRCNDETSDE